MLHCLIPVTIPHYQPFSSRPLPLHFLFFFSVSIPLKNVRKRRFRKTANKKVYHTPNQHNTHMGCPCMASCRPHARPHVCPPCKASCRPHAGLIQASCRPMQAHAGLMYAPCKASCMAHAGLMYGPCKASCMAHAGLMYGPCRPHVWPMQASCRPHTGLMQASYRPLAGLML